MDYENHFSIVNSLILIMKIIFSIVNRSICSSTTIVIIMYNIHSQNIHGLPGIRFRLVLIKHVFVYITPFERNTMYNTSI